MAKERETGSTAGSQDEKRTADQQFIVRLGNQFGNVATRLAEVAQASPDLEPGAAPSFKTLERLGKTIQTQVVSGARAASAESLTLLRADLERLSIKEMLDSANGLVDIGASDAQVAGAARLSFWGIIKCVAEALKCIVMELPFVGDRLTKIFCCLIDLICCLSGGSNVIPFF